MSRHLRILLLFFLLVSPALAAQEEKKEYDVLLLSSHTESSEWAQRMLQPFHGLLETRPDIHLSLNHLRLLSHENVVALQQAKEDVLNAHPGRPDLVILLGGSSFNFAVDIQQHWPGVPVILAGEQDYYCDIAYTLLGPGDPSAARYPLSTLKAVGLNFTLICTPFMIRRTVDMMFSLQPNMKKFIFIAGENYLCKERQWRLEKYLEDFYPDIDYQAISSTTTTTDQLLTILQEEAGSQTGVLYGSWLVREGYLENVSTRHNTVSLIESITPLYTMGGCDFEKHPNVVGCYTYTDQEYQRILEQRILDVLDHGIQPSTMPAVYLEAGVPMLNFIAMKRFLLDTNLIPQDAVVFGSPRTLWLTYKKTIMWLAFFLLVGLSLFIMWVMGRSMHSLKKARDMAQNANRMKTAFIQNMSHEVRTPLNAILGFTQLLCLPEGMVSDEERASYRDFVMNNADLLTVMINDMLSLSDMENGRYSVTKTATNLNEIARLAVKSTEHRLQPGVELIQEFGIPEDARFFTDGIRVQQILINFLTNACKYTSKGRIVVGSSLTENPGQITFYVADTGPGVPVDKSEEIFDRFVKLDQNKQGAGLGLSICRIVASNLGGIVWLDTRYTQGARFVLTFPQILA